MTGVAVNPPGSERTEQVMAEILNYRSVVAMRYAACPPGEVTNKSASAPFLVSRKLDGETWFLIVDPEQPRLVAPNGRTLTGDLPILTDLSGLPGGSIWAGELHVPSQQRERVGDVAAAIANDPDRLALGVFDLVTTDVGSWTDLPYPERSAIMARQLPDSGALFTIPVQQADGTTELLQILQEALDAGAEGVIARGADSRAFKIKPEITLDLAIIGYTTRTADTGDSEIRSLLLALRTEDDRYALVGASGNFQAGFDRGGLLNRLESEQAAGDFRQAAPTGQLYRMVHPKRIIECRVVDVQGEDHHSRPVVRPMATFHPDRGWASKGRAPAVALINAVGIRIRDDKDIDAGGARWQQVDHYASIPPTAAALPAAEVVRRQVWTKTTGERTDVRKLVVWKTNKETTDPQYPAFVVHWTDYNPQRKSPLNREVRPAPDLAAAQAHADTLIAANIKRGWVESGAAEGNGVFSEQAK